MNKKTIYWAAPVFTQAERAWNRACAENLRAKGHRVILPQDEANRFVTNGILDTLAVAEHCYIQATESPIMVAVLDGSDSDSGTSVEVGLRIGYRRAKEQPIMIIGIRTDFRVSEDDKLNAMFRLIRMIIYQPSFDEDVRHFCNRIEEVIQHSCAEPNA